ncbi:GntR family transcriptional regulator [Microbacterium protaetiae]|uniref:GntR family transcriptional regulator n=1 Tax=Microbacterium protaetiae TaxID=2509458 RepID=A0A4P6EHH6_9MICO|nr:GntR family transcriptional regulator [Microbacterium protaetiae]QAY59567.1 GntR family transcriptional regulator [Microbacterium protaetiae]
MATTSQTDLVYDRVRQAILSLRIVPGATLSERGLEAEYGASRTPVRAALMRLAGEGLVARDGRAWRVTPIDLDEVAALAEYREAVEAAAARLACERATDDELAALVIDEVPEGEDAGMRRGSEFHEGLAALGGNPFLTQAVRDAVTRMARARWLELRSAQDRDAAWHEHAAIVDAVRARDPQAAASAIARHTQANLDRLLASLRADRRVLGARGLQIVGE